MTRKIPPLESSVPPSAAKRRRRIEEIEWRMKEREIERARLLQARSPDSGYGSDASRGGMLDRLTKHPQLDSSPSKALSRPRYTVSTTNSSRCRSRAHVEFTVIQPAFVPAILLDGPCALLRL
ncbi:uncharacterized protein LAESUDRAFT_809070 [Laetiporus sulphureus 93-53]|uniref:Uncharacterized protein n=1 Tax=Laetiporus sulphureus 93-53 TaxID=1314785 RepID=A0A165HVS5_9APHY|nr:uncharacterized protein LAESUDRAFT_809070 [Laetiporus sulphureus 93-53]KZT12257.1 hypothetical protein LAESUDRAFT_809070 [Laetiporus sulphureus 93-53]